MNGPRPDNSIVSDLRLMVKRGVGRPLLLCLLGLAVIPAMLVGIAGDRRYAAHVEGEIPKTLRMTTALKRHELQTFFTQCLASTRRLSREPSTSAFFTTLKKRYDDADQPLDGFIDSPPWSTTVAAFDDAFQLHVNLHHYHDILLIDPHGHVIYSSARGTELAKDLNAAAHTGTILAAAFRETLTTGRRVFTGFSPYPTAGGEMTAFITTPLGPEGSPPTGVLACRIPIAAIDRLLETADEIADGLRVRLIDSAAHLVAGSRETALDHAGTPLDGPLIRRWREAAGADGTATEPATYVDARNHSWTGTYEHLQVDGQHYALLVEIDRQEALSPLVQLRRGNLTILILTGIAIVLAAVLLGRRFVSPPHQLLQRLWTLPGTNTFLPARQRTGNDIDHLETAFDALLQHTRKLQAESENRALLLSGLTCLHRRIGGDPELANLCRPTLDYLSEFLGLQRAEFYIIRDDGSLKRACRLPDRAGTEAAKIVFPGEGHVGQAAIEQSIIAYQTDAISPLLTAVPQTTLANLIAVPLMLRHSLKGVLELEKPSVFSLPETRFVEAAAEVITVALNAALIRQQEESLRQEYREQARQLKVREAALEASGQELMDQQRAFQDAEHHLQLKQLELEAANAQMAKNAADLESHMAVLEQQNIELEQAHRELAEKARQLELSSRYKTDFLANMSHELRTPLNSILLLSRLLLENKEENLSDRQFEFARTIHSAGEDLLNLINEILDLAKVESGKMTVEPKSVAVSAIAGSMKEAFAPLAEQKGVVFSVHVDPAVPPRLVTDRKRLEQIVKNFLSNAFKFTDAGEVRLAFDRAHPENTCDGEDAGGPTEMLAIAVSDTGIGIPADKQEMIFEAFQQVDGSIRREYGGTGLGLSISRELARMLCGWITVESRKGEGSRFTLYLPLPTSADETSALPCPPATVRRLQPPGRPGPESAPDRDRLAPAASGDDIRTTPGARCVLVIDTDPATADIARKAIGTDDCTVLMAGKLRTGLHFADYYRPEAIFIHLDHPEAAGWGVIRRIKDYPRNRATPVYILSSGEDGTLAVIHGAAGHLRTPITTAGVKRAFDRTAALKQASAEKTVLLVSPADDAATHLQGTLGGGALRFVQAVDGIQAAKRLGRIPSVDALVVDPEIGAVDCQALAAALDHRPAPLLCHPGSDASAASLQAKFHQAGLAIEATPIANADQLFVSLVACLHLNPEVLTDAQQARIALLDDRKPVLEGRKVLLADDDMRTVFALTSVLEERGVEIITGKSGKESLDKLGGFPEIDLVLLDVTMAGMDDYRAIQQVRQQQRHRKTPVIALTAKAMAGDRTRCIEAGADDYLSKPVDSDKLISMLSFWLDPHLMVPTPTTNAPIHQLPQKTADARE